MRGGHRFLPSRRKVLYGIAAATGLGTLSGPALGLQEHTLTIRGVGERAEYEFAVSGEVAKGPQADGGDRVLDGSVVRGAVGGEGTDDYRFTGQFTSFRLDGQVRVFVDGNEVELRRADDGDDDRTEDADDSGDDDDDDELPNTITIEAGDSDAAYQFTVSGEVVLGPNVDPADEISGGDTARGTVGPVAEARDDFRFSGRITSFEIDGPATVFVNGRRVDDPVGQPADRDEDDAPAPDAAFVLQQGDTCVPLSPLRAGNQTVTAFYDYDPGPSGPNVRQSNTGLERANTSRLFLYEGPDGLSLVFIHGGTEDEQGGSASFEVTGLPSGEWVVLDDSHEGTQDVFDIGEGEASLHWAWGLAGRSDGAVFRGLTGDAEVRVAPAFNDAARRDPLGPGRIERWQALSGSAEGPDATNLALDEPVVIRSGSC